MSYSIIWYERFGSDYRRTLLNQLISSICWNIVFQNMVNVPLEIILTTFGPLGEAFCLSHMILKNGSTFHIYTLLTFLTSVKYLYIFVFKNPTGIHSQFWCFVINIITAIASVVTQIVYLIVPGKNPITFYICIGQVPGSVQDQPHKKNYPIILTLLFSIVWYLFVFTKIKIFKKKISPEIVQGQTNSWALPPASQSVEKSTLANIGTIALIFTTTIPVSIVYVILNNVLSPKMLDIYPYYMILHFFHQGFGFIFNFFLLFIFISKSFMRNAILREIMTIFNKG
jgi:hypothetical protein